MNRLELEATRRRNLNLLDRSTGLNINALKISEANSMRHEMGKFFIFKFIRNGNDAELAIQAYKEIMQKKTENLSIINAVRNLEKELNNYFDKNPFVKVEKWMRPTVCSEVNFKFGGRADLFVLDSSTVIEVAETETELSLKRKEEKYKKHGLNFLWVKA